MNIPLNLRVTVTKTSRGDSDYIQIMSEDSVTINVVFVAAKIIVEDTRPQLQERDRR